MPTYDYVCDACDHNLELIQSFSELPKKECPECKRLTLRRVISGGIGVVFKGSGFYVTDTRGGSSDSVDTKKSDLSANAKQPSHSEKSDSVKSDIEKKSDSPASNTKSTSNSSKSAEKIASQ